MTGALPDRPRRRCLEGIALLVLVFGTRLVPDPARAQYVLYHASHGDWTVTCARDLTTTRVFCTLTAPPPKLDLKGGVLIAIDDRIQGSPALTFRLPGAVDPTRPVLALIDTAAPVLAKANRFGEGGWKGPAAQALIDAMRRGHRLSLVWSVAGDASPHTVDISLGAFAAGLDDYRQKLAAFGIADAR
jgi:invasion protein IalB